MSYKVAIRHNASGEVRLHAVEGFDFSMYIWTDGNYGCDCNRHLHFHRAAGVEPEEDCECGETAYSALYAELSDGTRIPIDEDLCTGVDGTCTIHALHGFFADHK